MDGRRRIVAKLIKIGCRSPVFDHCLYFNTAALARRLDREWARAYSPFGLTTPQGFMLRAVLARPGLLQSELADDLEIARPTVTRALDALQEKGLVRREGRSGDGRQTAIVPTASALEMAEDLKQASAGVSRRLQGILGDDGFADAVTRVRSVRSALR